MLFERSYVYFVDSSYNLAFNPTTSNVQDMNLWLQVSTVVVHIQNYKVKSARKPIETQIVETEENIKFCNELAPTQPASRYTLPLTKLLKYLSSRH